MFDIKSFIEEDKVLYPLNELCKRISGQDLGDITFTNLSQINDLFKKEWNIFEKILNNYTPNEQKGTTSKISKEMLEMFSTLGIETNTDDKKIIDEIDVNELDLVSHETSVKWSSNKDRFKAENELDEETIILNSPEKSSFVESDINELITFLSNDDFWNHYFKQTNKTYDFDKWNEWVKKNQLLKEREHDIEISEMKFVDQNSMTVKSSAGNFTGTATSSFISNE